MAILILKVNPAGSFFPPSRQCWSWRVHNCLIYTGTKLFPGLPHLSIKSFISMTFCFSLNQTSLSLLSTAVHVCVLTMWWFSPGVTAIKSCCKSLCGHGRNIRWSNMIFVSFFGKKTYFCSWCSMTHTSARNSPAATAFQRNGSGETRLWAIVQFMVLRLWDSQDSRDSETPDNLRENDATLVLWW